MSDEISRVIEKDAKRVGKAIADGAGRAVHDVMHETRLRITKNVESHELHDRNAASDLEKAGRHGDETPSTHAGGPTGAAPVTGTGTGAVHETPSVGGAGGSTTRDAQGRLRNPDGTFAKEPGSTGNYIDRAQPGDKSRREVSGAGRADYDATLAARTDAANAKSAAGKQIDELASKYGVDPKDLSAKGNDGALRQLRRNGASRAEVEQARTAAEQARAADLDLHRQSERLGMQAGEDVLRQDGYQQISGSSERAGRPGEADLIGVSPDGNSIKVVEAKGGTASLGDGRYLPDHEPPGRAQQGSGAYLDDLLRRDPGFQSALQSNPALRQAYENGTLKIDYTVVSASPTGRVTETPLVSR